MKVVVPADEIKFHATVQVSPMVVSDMTFVEKLEGDKTDDDDKDKLTKRISKSHKPQTLETAKKDKGSEKNEILERKIALCLKSRMPIETIADVLDLPLETVYVHLDKAMAVEVTSRDVLFKEAFTFFVHDPNPVEVNLEFFSLIKKKEDSIGTANIKVSSLMQYENMTFDIKRRPLDNPKVGRSPLWTGQVKLWPIVSMRSAHAP